MLGSGVVPIFVCVSNQTSGGWSRAQQLLVADASNNASKQVSLAPVAAVLPMIKGS